MGEYLGEVEYVPSRAQWQYDLSDVTEEEWADVEALGWDTYEGYVAFHERLNAKRNQAVNGE